MTEPELTNSELVKRINKVAAHHTADGWLWVDGKWVRLTAPEIGGKSDAQ